jgi:hypothetical protein
MWCNHENVYVAWDVRLRLLRPVKLSANADGWRVSWYDPAPWWRRIRVRVVFVQSLRCDECNARVEEPDELPAGKIKS